MKKILLFSIVLSFAFVLSSCKSKQKVVSISGADIEAVEDDADADLLAEEELDNERVIDEKFTLSDGDQGTFYKKYHVVVGSFSIQNNANNLQRTLKNEGNNAIVVVNDMGMYRVIIASYDDYSHAKDRISQLQDRFADAWVLRQK